MSASSSTSRSETGMSVVMANYENPNSLSVDGVRSVGPAPPMTWRGPGLTRIRHGDLELQRFPRRHRGEPVAANPEAEPQGWLSVYLTSLAPSSRLLHRRHKRPIVLVILKTSARTSTYAEIRIGAYFVVALRWSM